MNRIRLGAPGLIFGCLGGISLLLSCLVSFAHAGVKVYQQSSQLGLVVDAPQPLFKVTNFIPGGEARGVMTIRNEGSGVFTYKIGLHEEKDGDNEMSLLDVLLVRIMDEDGAEKYNGSLRELQDIEEMSLPPGGREELTWVVSFPLVAGNQYQGARADFDIIVNARGTGGGNGGGGNGGGDDSGGSGNDGGGTGGDAGDDSDDSSAQGITEPVDMRKAGEEISTADDSAGEAKRAVTVVGDTDKSGQAGRLAYTGGNYLGYLFGGVGLLVCRLLMARRFSSR